jgi:sulfur-oxidizing protein SoxY
MAVASIAIFLTTDVPTIADSRAGEKIWSDLKDELFSHRTLREDGAIIKLGAPLAAQNAAIVPITLHINSMDPNLLADDPRRVTKVTLVIDENPSPIAAVFELGPTARVTKIETRVRVNQNTLIHAVAETVAGQLYVSESSVAAAGGCSAPNGNIDVAGPPLGTIRVREMKPEYVSNDGRRKETVVMIKHPNHSGMQVDQKTHLYIAARYIDFLGVTQGGSLIFKMTGGISISEDPNIRFDYLPNGSGKMGVTATDSKGSKFSKTAAVEPAM